MGSLNSPQQVIKIAQRTAEAKLSKPFADTLTAAFLAGTYIAMGGALSIVVGFGFPEITAANPALQRLLSGALFPLGLILVVFAGAELFTGNNAILVPGVLNRQYSVWQVLKNWTLVWLGNFIGALFFAYVLIYLTGIFNDIWQGAAVSIAEAKCSLSWMQAFLRGIGANWLVCLAVWLCYAAQSTSGKIVGMWFPVMCFVALGYEHCIANMFFIPLGMLFGADISVSAMFVDNLIPATLGNIVGGALFVGLLYWYLGRKE